MPIIIDPDLPEPEPPVTATGPDGVLTATVDAQYAGVLLVADYTGWGPTYVANPGIDANTTGWTAYQLGGTTTLTRNTSTPLTGAGSLQMAWTAGSTSAGAYLTLGEAIPAGSRVTIKFHGRCPNVMPTRLRCGLADASGNFLVFDLDPAATETAYVVNTTVPEGETLTRVYFYANGGMGSSGSWLLDDVEVLRPLDGVRFIRTNPDGSQVAVRSGDVALAPGRIAVAYDHEAPLGVGVGWHAVPVLGGVEGEPSDGVTLSVPAPEWPLDLWLKSLEDPGLSLRVQVEEWAELATSAQASTVQALDGKYPQVNFRTRTATTSTITVITEDLVTLEQMRALIDSGLLLVQTRAEYGRPDQFVLPGGVSEVMTAKAYHPTRRWQLELTEVQRPSTTGQRLRVIGRSYQDRLEAFPTYSDVPARTYLEALTG